jgi:hypothetical protein
MTICSPQTTAKFMALEPTSYGTHTNKLGQIITFYEHPLRGDEAPVYGMIEGVLFVTDFWETDDMEAEHGEYTPLLVDGKIHCGFEID